MKHWVGVVSRDHVQRGVALSIAQIGHGKRSGLARMHAGDGFVYYSPVDSMSSNVPLRAFTAIGRIEDEVIWRADEDEFKPWRRRVSYVSSTETPIRPLLDDLSFTRGKVGWGYAFRYGLVEVTEADFGLIAKAMKANL